MTNFKARGFDSPAQLKEHLDDVVETDNDAEGGQLDNDEDAQTREVAWLRKDVSDLWLQVDAIYGRAEVLGSVTVEAGVPWLKIVGALALSYVLARVARVTARNKLRG
jgi:hypothetical protein